MVNDGRRAFESRAEQHSKPPTVVPVLKVSDAKKAFESSASAAKAERHPAGSQGGSSHHSLPRRTLIQTPAEVTTKQPVQPKKQSESPAAMVSI